MGACAGPGRLDGNAGGALCIGPVNCGWTGACCDGITDATGLPKWVLPPVAWGMTEPLACSYRPGGKVLGINDSLLAMEAWMRYMAIVKSVESSAPRSCVSHSDLYWVLRMGASRRGLERTIFATTCRRRVWTS